jgi:hypothetical protein
MKKTPKILSLSLLLCLVFTLAPAEHVELAEAKATQSSYDIVSDAFGYMLNPTAPINWEDLKQTGSRILMPDDDNAVSLRSLGFLFPFYEEEYTHVYISIDGVIYLGITPPPVTINIRPLPFEAPPNALIAPLWEDLTLVLDSIYNEGDIYIKWGENASGKYFAIQWDKVYRLGSNVPLTFQAILMENGDIRFNYKSIGNLLPGAPIGMEDPDGIDGMQFVYNNQYFQDSNDNPIERSIYIKRPGPGPRLKAYPVLQGGFLEAQTARFVVNVRNTGTDTDSYTLLKEHVAGNPDWMVRFLNEHNEPITQTPSIGTRQEASVTVEINSYFAPIGGDFSKVKVTFQSTVNTAKKFSVEIQAAVPSEFAKVHVQQQATSVLFRSQASGQLKTIPEQSRNSLAILRLGGGKYVAASDQESSGDTSSIQFTFVDTTLLDEHITYSLPDNSNLIGLEGTLCPDYPLIVRDLAPAMAITPDGNIGVIFIRERLGKFNVGGVCMSRMNSNIWFATIKPNGVHLGPYPITRNTRAGTQQMADVEFYTTPNIAATSDNRFTLTWIRKKSISGGAQVSDLFAATFSMDKLTGNGTIVPMALTNGMQHERFYDPAIIALKGGGSAIVTSVFKTDWMEYYFKLFYLNSDGSLVEGGVMNLERGMQGLHADLLQLRNGNLFMGFVTPDFGAIGYALITPDKNVHRCAMPVPTGDSLDYVSLTTDAAGNGVLTWADRLTSRHFYALVSPNPPGQPQTCVLLTPPMMYGTWPVEDTLRSHYNQHSTVASLGSPSLFIPLIGQ